MESTVTFPKCFSSASYKLRSKFRRIDPAIIEDSLQYASIQYWEKNISSTIPNPEEALGWIIYVAKRYIEKENRRQRRQSPIRDARKYYVHDLETQIACRECLRSINPDSIPTVVKYVSGYSLKEIASSVGLSVVAIKKRQSRERKVLREKVGDFFR